MLKQWWRRRQLAARNAEFRAGYDWAAGALLRAELTPIGVSGITYPPRHPYDFGADAATDRMIALGVVKDDR